MSEVRPLWDEMPPPLKLHVVSRGVWKAGLFRIHCHLPEVVVLEHRQRVDLHAGGSMDASTVLCDSNNGSRCVDFLTRA